MKEKSDWKPLDLIDERAYARELNEHNLDEEKTDTHLIGFFKKINPKGYVNNLDLKFIIKALKKAGAMEIKKEPFVSFQRFNNMTGGRYIGHPLRFDIKYIGPLDFNMFYELIYN